MERYGVVSFSGTTSAGPFYRQILSGRKTRTLRERRKDGRPHVKPGYAFTMYWEVRKKKDEKPIHYIGTAECIAYEPVKIVDHWEDQEFAESEGFEDLEEFRDWWYLKWRDVLWLDDVIEAYKQLKDRDVLVATMGRKFGKTSISEFLQLEYMMIQWKHPLIEEGSLHT